MTVRLKTFRIGEARGPGEGLRLGVVRYLPRGVKKSDYKKLDLFDLWYPLLAPSRELLRQAKAWPEFSREKLRKRYVGELLKDTDKRQTLLLLGELAKKTPISIGCYCEEERHCHRSILLSVLKAASRTGGGKLLEQLQRSRGDRP